MSHISYLLQNPAIADVYTEHAHSVGVAKYSPSGFYIASGGKGPGHQRVITVIRLPQVFHMTYVFFFSFLLEMIRCIWKGSHLGHHPERAHTQVWVHPLCRHCQGHCLDRRQQKDGCCWGRTWEVSLGVIPLQINSKPAVKWQCYTGFIVVCQASFSRIIHMHLFSQGTLTSSHNPNVWALV